jgi:hypothetical protein
MGRIKNKRVGEASWQRNARISAWKKQQYGWVVHTSQEPSGYIAQVNEVFGIISAVTPTSQGALRMTHEHAYEVVTLLRQHNRKCHMEYAGPLHPDEAK